MEKKPESFFLFQNQHRGSQDLPDNAYVDGARTEYAMLKIDEAANSGNLSFLQLVIQNLICHLLRQNHIGIYMIGKI